MDRFWIEVMCEVSKDAMCDLAAAIEQGKPSALALHRAFCEVEQLKHCLLGLSETFTILDADEPVTANGKAV